MCTQDGFCPLYVASQEGHDTIVEVLLQTRATVDLQTKVKIVLLSLMLYHVLYSLYSKYHITLRGM